RRRQDAGRLPAQPDRPGEPPALEHTAQSAHPLYLAAEGPGGGRRAEPQRPHPADGAAGGGRKPHRRHRHLAPLCAWEGARAYFETLACVILDEIHTLHASKRGDLLALDLARLQQLSPNLRRVGLSATVDDPEVIKRWMACHRPVEVVLPSPLRGG